MLVLMSPARNTKPAPVPGLTPTPLLFPRQVARIAEALRSYSPLALQSLLDAQPKMAMALFESYQHFDLSGEGFPALSSFYGAAFRNMEVHMFTEADFRFAQEHLRIFSALYGLLRPMDGILNHRLGLRGSLTVQGQDLYQFWGNRIYQSLHKEKRLLVNLASQDYTKLITPYFASGDQMIHCRFLVQKPGGPRGTVATVRIARGRMAQFIIKQRITRPQDLQTFDWNGYRYAPEASEPLHYVFVQETPGMDA